jgi:hypothetical protein
MEQVDFENINEKLDFIYCPVTISSVIVTDTPSSLTAVSASSIVNLP